MENGVLILIVMEHALGATGRSYVFNKSFVLILIVMEHALGEIVSASWLPMLCILS